MVDIKKVILGATITMSGNAVQANETTTQVPNENKTEIKTDSVSQQNNVSSISFEDAQKLAELEAKLNSPVAENDINSQRKKGSIGAFSIHNLSDEINDTENLVTKVPNQQMYGFSRNDLYINEQTLTKEDLESAINAEKIIARGLYDNEMKDITLNHLSFDKEAKQYVDSLKQQNKDLSSTPKKNIPANSSYNDFIVMIHELEHFKHDKYDGMNIKGDSPINYVLKNMATERVAHASEYLTVAAVYTNMKELGVKDVQIDGKNYELSSLCNNYKGLQELLDKKTMDFNNADDIRSIVACSVKDWTEKDVTGNTRTDVYKSNFKDFADFSDNNANYIAQAKIAFYGYDKHYNDDINRMLSNIKVQGKTLDLNYCKDLLTVDKSEAEKICGIENSSEQAKFQESLKELYEHLDKKGLKTDEGKNTYLNEEFKKIVNRNPQCDKKLKDILLKSGDDIQYSDGLLETYQLDEKGNFTGKIEISNGYKGKKYLVDRSGKDSATQNKEVTKSMSDNSSKTKMAELIYSKSGRVSPANSCAKSNGENIKTNTAQINNQLLNNNSGRN